MPLPPKAHPPVMAGGYPQDGVRPAPYCGQARSATMRGMHISRTVRRASVLWTVAVTAGVVESMLAVAAAAGQGPLGPDIWGQIGVRLVVYALSAVLIIHFRRGRRWARIALTVLLTGLGLGSLMLPAAAAMAGGAALSQALSDGGELGWLFVTVRLVHIACVVAASVLMFTPSANGYFRNAGLRTAVGGGAPESGPRAGTSNSTHTAPG